MNNSKKKKKNTKNWQLFVSKYIFKRQSGENCAVQKPLNCLKVTPFNLMLTACDVVICHLLMTSTGLTKKKKEKKNISCKKY